MQGSTIVRYEDFRNAKGSHESRVRITAPADGIYEYTVSSLGVTIQVYAKAVGKFRDGTSRWKWSARHVTPKPFNGTQEFVDARFLESSFESSSPNAAWARISEEILLPTFDEFFLLDETETC